LPLSRGVLLHDAPRISDQLALCLEACGHMQVGFVIEKDFAQTLARHLSSEEHSPGIGQTSQSSSTAKMTPSRSFNC
jgi:hypothetical protein